MSFLRRNRCAERVSVHLIESRVGRPAIVFQPVQRRERPRPVSAPHAMDHDRSITRVVDQAKELFQFPRVGPGPALFVSHRPLDVPHPDLVRVDRFLIAVGLARIDYAAIEPKVEQLQADDRPYAVMPRRVREAELRRLGDAIKNPRRNDGESLQVISPEAVVAADQSRGGQQQRGRHAKAAFARGRSCGESFGGRRHARSVLEEGVHVRVEREGNRCLELRQIGRIVPAVPPSAATS